MKFWWNCEPAAITGRLTAIHHVPVTATARVPNLDTKKVADNTLTMEPTDSPNRMKPICAVEAWSESRTAGVLVTHDAIAMPCTRNSRNWAYLRAVTMSLSQGDYTWQCKHSASVSSFETSISTAT
jgi:hypothetical protein